MLSVLWQRGADVHGIRPWGRINTLFRNFKRVVTPAYIVTTV